MMNTHPTMLLLAAAVLTSCGDKDGTDSGATTTDSGGETAEVTYDFDPDGPEAFTQVDRLGMPAVSTALITSKDAYNESDPADDVAGEFVGEIIGGLTAVHSILDDDLKTLGLTPCTVVGDGTGTCVAQGAPLILPDTLKVDVSLATTFPNGRGLPDPVIDITLAVVLLDLGTHSADTLVGVLNPAANDVPFLDTFPYLAEPK